MSLLRINLSSNLWKNMNHVDAEHFSERRSEEDWSTVPFWGGGASVYIRALGMISWLGVLTSKKKIEIKIVTSKQCCKKTSQVTDSDSSRLEVAIFDLTWLDSIFHLNDLTWLESPVKWLWLDSDSTACLTRVMTNDSSHYKWLE